MKKIITKYFHFGPVLHLLLIFVVSFLQVVIRALIWGKDLNYILKMNINEYSSLDYLLVVPAGIIILMSMVLILYRLVLVSSRDKTSKINTNKFFMIILKLFFML